MVGTREARRHRQNGFNLAKSAYASTAALMAGSIRASSRPVKRPAAKTRLGSGRRSRMAPRSAARSVSCAGSIDGRANPGSPWCRGRRNRAPTLIDGAAAARVRWYIRSRKPPPASSPSWMPSRSHRKLPHAGIDRGRLSPPNKNASAPAQRGRGAGLSLNANWLLWSNGTYRSVGGPSFDRRAACAAVSNRSIKISASIAASIAQPTCTVVINRAARRVCDLVTERGVPGRWCDERHGA